MSVERPDEIEMGKQLCNMVEGVFLDQASEEEVARYQKCHDSPAKAPMPPDATSWEIAMAACSFAEAALRAHVKYVTRLGEQARQSFAQSAHTGPETEPTQTIRQLLTDSSNYAGDALLDDVQHLKRLGAPSSLVSAVLKKAESEGYGVHDSLVRTDLKGREHFELVYKACTRFAITHVKRGAVHLRDSLKNSPEEIVEGVAEALAKNKPEPEDEAEENHHRHKHDDADGVIQ
jgi:hypothetical protein